MKFGDNLKQIRKSRNISQESLAEILGVSRQSISKWETGENFPSMQNIMCLCDIFKCKINDLVHEDFVDIDSLDEEIKMSIVKFKKEKQKHMKALSKVIYILSKVASIVSGVSIGILASLMILLPITYKYITIDDYKIKLKDTVVGDAVTTESIVINYINNHSKKEIIICTEIIFITMIVSLFLLRMITNYLYKLFKNINEEDTPFTMDNVSYIRKISVYVLLYVFVPNMFGILSQLIMNVNLGMGFELTDVIFGLIIFGISYIFEYGYQIQLDSKGKMYGDTDE